jgi:TonB family protein
MLLSSALLLAGASLPAFKNSIGQHEGIFLVVARVEVAEDGRIAGIGFRQKIQPVLQDYLRQRIAPWRFEPVRKDGKAVTGSTSLALRLRQADDGKGVEIVSVRAGPTQLTVKEPYYFDNHVHAGYQGSLTIRCKVNAKRRCVDASVAESTAHPTLAENLLLALRKWSFEPDEVEGRPVETWITLPLCFRGNDSAPADCDAPPEGRPEVFTADTVQLRRDSVSLP